jgi:hypothetical protein
VWASIAGYSSRWAGVRTPATSETTAGCESGNCIAAARSGTPWRRGVVEPATRPRIGQDPAVHDPADQHRDPALDARRHELVQCALVEQRVAVGDQEDVHVRLAGEPGQHG